MLNTGYSNTSELGTHITYTTFVLYNSLLAQDKCGYLLEIRDRDLFIFSPTLSDLFLLSVATGLKTKEIQQTWLDALKWMNLL